MLLRDLIFHIKSNTLLPCLGNIEHAEAMLERQGRGPRQWQGGDGGPGCGRDGEGSDRGSQERGYGGHGVVHGKQGCGGSAAAKVVDMAVASKIVATSVA